MSVFSKKFWDTHCVVRVENEHRTELSKVEKDIMRVLSALPPAVPKPGGPKKKDVVKCHNRKGAHTHEKLTQADIDCYSDDSDYDADDVKKYLRVTLQQDHIVAGHGNDDANNEDDDDAVEDEDEFDIDAADADADVDAADVDAADEYPDDEDADDAADEYPDDEDDAGGDVNFDIWPVIERFKHQGVVLPDITVNTIVNGLGAEKPKFIREYRRLYNNAEEILRKDNVAERNGKDLRGIINFLFYMGKDTYGALLDDLDFLQMTIDSGEVFYPQVQF